MVRVIQRVLKYLFDIVHQVTSKMIGADEMFPLFLYILIRSRMSSNVHLYLKFMNNFLTSGEKMGEGGYCLVTLEGI